MRQCWPNKVSVTSARSRRGQTLLINGACGGVGTLGLQLSKLHGLQVTGVDSTAKQDFLRSQGFDQVIDYSQYDFQRPQGDVVDGRARHSRCTVPVPPKQIGGAAGFVQTHEVGDIPGPGTNGPRRQADRVRTGGPFS